MPIPLRKCFSVSRSCVDASACGRGSTGLWASSTAAVWAGTFSNSYVTTATDSAKAASAASSS